MAYINWTSLATAEPNGSLWQRLHWERLAMLVINFALWAMIITSFA